MFQQRDSSQSFDSPFRSTEREGGAGRPAPAPEPASPLARLRGLGGVTDAAPNAELFGHYAEPARAQGGLGAFALQLAAATRQAAGGTTDGTFAAGAVQAQRRVGMGDLRLAEARGQEREDRAAERDRLLHQTGGDAQAVAGKMIGGAYMDPDKMSPDLVNPDEKLGKLETKEERTAALAKLMQNDPANPASTDMCGPTALIAASLYAQGGQGMETLMGQIEEGQAGDGKKRNEDPEFKALREKMKKGGEMSVADVQMMQEHLYKHLRDRQKADPRFTAEQNAEGGVDGAVMQDFIKGSPELAKMFKDNKMSMNMVDTNGDKKLNHYVLGIQDDEREKASDYTPYNTVYDPFARKGGQLVTEKGQVLDYDHARHQSLTG